MTAILTEIINLLTNGLTSFAAGIGGGLNEMAESLFIVTSGTTSSLSVFGGLCIIFAAIALCVGITKYVVNWVTSFGK